MVKRQTPFKHYIRNGTANNPKIGDIRLGDEIGYKNREKYIFFECPICKIAWWVPCRNDKPRVTTCVKCKYIIENSSNFKGTVDNPILGDIRQGKDIGKKPKALFIWHSCVGCGKNRWIRYDLKKQSPSNLHCRKCGRQNQTRLRGEGNSNWQGGKIINNSGYPMVWIANTSPFYSMTNGHGYLAEHRLVMAQHLGRPLERIEYVHHKNGIKTDNRIDNLELTDNRTHIKAHSIGYRDGYIKGLKDGEDKQIKELKYLIQEQTKQIKLLQWRLQNKVGINE